MAFLLLPALALGHLHSVHRRRLVVADSVDAEDPRRVADLRQHGLRLQARRVDVRVHSLEEVVLGVVLVRELERVEAGLRLVRHARQLFPILVLEARKLILTLARHITVMHDSYLPQDKPQAPLYSRMHAFNK